MSEATFKILVTRVAVSRVTPPYTSQGNSPFKFWWKIFNLRILYPNCSSRVKIKTFLGLHGFAWLSGLFFPLFCAPTKCEWNWGNPSHRTAVEGVLVLERSDQIGARGLNIPEMVSPGVKQKGTNILRHVEYISNGHKLEVLEHM